MPVRIKQLRNQTGGTSLKGNLRSKTWTLTPKANIAHLISCGPIVEQGTHFCDLSRYFGGDVDIDSVVAHSVEWDEAPGKLSKMSIDESKIAPEDRIPRITSATWLVN